MSEFLPPNLRSLRESYGLTQQRLADVLGLNRVQWALYEAGARNPPLGTLEKVSDLFSVTLHELLTTPIAPVLRLPGAEMSETALRGVAAFFRIVRNYQRMETLSQQPK